MDMFTAKRIELMIDVATKKLINEVQTLRGQVQKLEGEVAELRKRASNGHAQSVPQPMQTQVQQQKPITDFPSEKKVGADVPRYGNYTSNDVSVEKFFNFGSGKKR